MVVVAGVDLGVVWLVCFVAWVILVWCSFVVLIILVFRVSCEGFRFFLRFANVGLFFYVCPHVGAKSLFFAVS